MDLSQIKKYSKIIDQIEKFNDIIKSYEKERFNLIQLNIHDANEYGEPRGYGGVFYKTQKYMTISREQFISMLKSEVSLLEEYLSSEGIIIN